MKTNKSSLSAAEVAHIIRAVDNYGIIELDTDSGVRDIDIKLYGAMMGYSLSFVIPFCITYSQRRYGWYEGWIDGGDVVDSWYEIDWLNVVDNEGEPLDISDDEYFKIECAILNQIIVK